MVVCARCGAESDEGQAFCSRCGAPLPEAPLAGAPVGGGYPRDEPADGGAPHDPAPQARVSLEKGRPVEPDRGAAPPPAPAEPDGHRPVPFEDVAGIPGFLSRVVTQVGMTVSEPGRMFDRVPRTDGILPPFLLWLTFHYPVALFQLGIGVVVVLGLGTLAIGGVLGVNDSDVQMLSGLGAGILLAVAFGWLVVVPAMSFVGMVANGTIQHFALTLLGGTASGRGVAQSIRAHGYCYALTGIAGLLLLIPYLGALLFMGTFVATLILNGWGLARVHGTDPWRGIVAALVPGLLVCCCGAAVVSVIVGSIASGL